MRFPLTRAGSVALVVAATMAGSSAADAAPSWGPSTTLGPTTREVGAPEVAVAPDGEAIATWVGRRPYGVKVSTRRPGRGWSAPVTISRIGEEVEGPRIAVSARKAVIVWSDSIRTRSGTARVVLATTRLHGKGWSRPRNVSAEKQWYEEPEGREPQVAMTRGGKAIVVWTASNEGHSTVSFIASSTQAALGTDWTAPVGIRGSFEGEVPQVAMTPGGEAVAIWGAYYNEESYIAVSSRPPKGPWKGAGLLATPGPFPQPQLAVTSKGEAVGAWVEPLGEAVEGKVQVTTRTPGGKWRVKTLEPQELGVAPRIVTEPGGWATVIWVKSAAFAFEEGTVLASTHVPGGGWGAPRSVAAEGLQLPGLSESPIAVTREGESIALWASTNPIGGGLTIQSASRRGRQPWSAPTQVSTSPPGPFSGAAELQLAIGPDGEAFAVWRCFNGTRWVIETATRRSA